jgi:hypothetical protein
MGMKCPNCGSEEPDYAVYCGKCAGLMKEREQSTGSPEKSERLGSPVQMVFWIKDRFTRMFMKSFGIGAVIVGAFFAIAGALATSMGGFTDITINGRVVLAEEGGQTFFVIGLALLFVGYVLRYAHHKMIPERA